jgi:ATP-dependent Clp protease protease subunit
MTTIPPQMIFALADGGDALELDIFDGIGAHRDAPGITAKDIRRRLAAAPKAKNIRVTINSTGGAVTEGMAIHALLTEHPARVEVHVVGLAASIASIIAMAGQRITMAAGSFMMIHEPWAIAVGSESDMRSTGQLLAKIRGEMVAIYAGRTRRSSEQVEAWMRDETWFTSDEAVANGFADAVVKPKPATKTAAQAFASLHADAFAKAPAAIRHAVAGALASRGSDDETREEQGQWVRDSIALADHLAGRKPRYPLPQAVAEALRIAEPTRKDIGELVANAMQLPPPRGHYDPVTGIYTRASDNNEGNRR